MFSTDLKDAYFQIHIHPNFRSYLWFILSGTVYQFKTFYYLLSSATQVFTRVFNLVSKQAHEKGIRLIRYLDDWLVVAELVPLLFHYRVLLCQDLMIVINWEKIDLEPTSRAHYLGMLIATI